MNLANASRNAKLTNEGVENKLAKCFQPNLWLTKGDDGRTRVAKEVFPTPPSPRTLTCKPSMILQDYSVGIDGRMAQNVATEAVAKGQLQLGFKSEA